MKTQLPSNKDIVRLFGPIQDHSVAEILALVPTYEELERVAAYVAGESDVMGEERHPLSGIAASVYEIVVRDKVEEDDKRR